jgi:hypothetical protein
MVVIPPTNQGASVATIKIKKRVMDRQEKPAVTDPEPPTTWQLENGESFTVGETVMVKHYSKDSWFEAVIKRITEENSEPIFHFYIPSPGSISLPLDRVKKVKKKQVRIKKTNQGENQ